jgi:hypothetical protein
VSITNAEFEQLVKQYTERFGEDPDTFAHCGLGPDGLADALRRSLDTGEPLLQTPDVPEDADI